MIARLTRLALGLASALGGPVVSQGQIACLQPSGCNLAHRSSRELIVVKVAVKPGDTPAKTAVSFVASAGSLSKASDSTDATGTARVIWTGDGSNAQAVVTASALLKDSLHSVTIALGEHYELSLLKPRTRLLGLPL
ncbi:MAG TPA: hypothetical protein VHM30_04275, partial [Gemmatimonadaceae bacterium]|nr:hypothetical protein [Gemmatimonadaceae bacterium]